MLQQILNFRKEKKGTYVSTTHTMTIGEYKAIASDLLIYFERFEVNNNRGTIELTIIR